MWEMSWVEEMMVTSGWCWYSPISFLRLTETELFLLGGSSSSSSSGSGTRARVQTTINIGIRQQNIIIFFIWPWDNQHLDTDQIESNCILTFTWIFFDIIIFAQNIIVLKINIEHFVRKLINYSENRAFKIQ